MKLFSKIVPLTVLILLAGCVREEYGFCPSLYVDNVQLEYCLPDKSGNCVFMDNVSNVELAIFNETGSLMEIQSFTRAMLEQRKGALLSLEPGIYHVLGWANTGTNTQHQGISAGSACHGANVTYKNISANMVGDCDRVYYTKSGPYTRSGVGGGQFRMTVTEAGYNGKVDFRASHRQLQILVKGFNDGHGNTYPAIELSGLKQGINFFDTSALTDQQGNTLCVASRKNTTATISESETLAGALFNTFWFEKENDIVIKILDPTTGNVIDTIPLKDVLEEGSDQGEVKITLKLEYRSTGVTVTVDGWSGGKTVIDFD